MSQGIVRLDIDETELRRHPSAVLGEAEKEAIFETRCKDKFQCVYDCQSCVYMVTN